MDTRNTAQRSSASREVHSGSRSLVAPPVLKFDGRGGCVAVMQSHEQQCLTLLAPQMHQHLQGLSRFLAGLPEQSPDVCEWRQEIAATLLGAAS
jgi:hypothetical protein